MHELQRKEKKSSPSIFMFSRPMNPPGLALYTSLSCSTESHDCVSPLHLHAVAYVELVDEELMLDAGWSLLGELRNSVLELVAKALNHVAADEESSPGNCQHRTYYVAK